MKPLVSISIILTISLSRKSAWSLWLRKRSYQSLPILDRAITNITYVEPRDDIIDDDIVWNSLPSRRLATRPFSWEQLIDICRKKQDLSLHSRSFHEQRNYLLFKRNILDKYWTSVHDYILCDKFQFERRLMRNDQNDEIEPFRWNARDGRSSIIGYFKEQTILGSNDTLSTEANKYTPILTPPLGFKFCAYPKLESLSQRDVQMCLAMNDFPYFVQPGVEHWCLWKLGGNVTKEDIDEALSILKQTVRKSRSGLRKLIDSLSFVNPTHLKSVKAIDHAHILCLWEEDR